MKENMESNFEEPFKTQENIENVQDYDSIHNVYANYKYSIAYDGPNHWEADYGVSEHSIYRTYQRDSGITFSINVIEIKEKSIDSDENIDIWQVSDKLGDKFNNDILIMLKNKFNTEVEEKSFEKTYLKNKKAIRREYEFTLRNFQDSFDYTAIMYQIHENNNTITYDLMIPTVLLSHKEYENDKLFTNIFFLKNRESISDYINQNL